MKTKIIDTKDAWIPSGFLLESHIDMGELDWNKIKVDLYLSEKQKTGYIKGEELLKELKQPLNSAVAKYLFEHQELIPKEWEKYRLISFFGTILRDPNGDRGVLYLARRDGGEWDWGVSWLGDGWYDWDARDVSPVLASPLNLDTEKPVLSHSDSLTLESRIKVLEDWKERVTNAMSYAGDL